MRLALAAGLILFTSACDKVPLLAPSGTVITLFPVQDTVPLNGSVEIVATVIEQGVAQPPPTTPEPTTPGTPTTPAQPTQPTTPTPSQGAGTPVQNGTVVSFTTTIGRIEPAEARTQNGQVRVRFFAGNQSGIATITAFSGGASGRIENLRVGTAAVERVVLSANPQSLGPLGGTSELQARVEDTNGQGVSGVEVSFTSSTGSVSPNPATTDANGIARATLTTSREATVVARVAAAESNEVQVTLNPRTGLRITPPAATGTPPAALQPLVFTVSVGEQALVRNVEISWGDGTETTLGAISGETQVAHTFEEAGTYTVTATATDATGFSESVSTVVTVLPAQPPSVTVTVSNNSPGIREEVVVTATVSGNTSPIVRYEWNFGEGANATGTITTTSNSVRVFWNTPGSKVITVRVIQAQGPSSDGFGSVNVRSGAD